MTSHEICLLDKGEVEYTQIVLEILKKPGFKTQFDSRFERKILLDVNLLVQYSRSRLLSLHRFECGKINLKRQLSILSDGFFRYRTKPILYAQNWTRTKSFLHGVYMKMVY